MKATTQYLKTNHPFLDVLQQENGDLQKQGEIGNISRDIAILRGRDRTSCPSCWHSPCPTPWSLCWVTVHVTGTFSLGNGGEKKAGYGCDSTQDIPPAALKMWVNSQNAAGEDGKGRDNDPGPEISIQEYMTVLQCLKSSQGLEMLFSKRLSTIPPKKLR